MSDLSLVEAFRILGDPTEEQYGAAWTLILQEVIRLTPAVCNRMRVSSHDQDDIASDVTTRLIQGDANRDKASDGHVRGCLRTAIRNMALDRIRKSGREASLEGLENESDSGRDVSRPRAGEAEEAAEVADRQGFLAEAVETAVAAQRRKDARANLRQGLDELELLASEKLSREELYRRESGMDSPGEKDIERARARVHQRHSRARKRFLKYVRARVEASDSESARWAELESLILGRWA